MLKIFKPNKFSWALLGISSTGLVGALMFLYQRVARLGWEWSEVVSLTCLVLVLAVCWAALSALVICPHGYWSGMLYMVTSLRDGRHGNAVDVEV